MKSKLIVLVVLCLSLSHYAQLQKGRMFLGGNVNYYQSSTNANDTTNGYKTQTNKYSNFQLNLNVGYFVSDHLALGILGTIQKYKSDYENEDLSPGYSYTSSNTQNNYSVGLFARYYQMIKESKFGVFAQLNGSYGKGVYEYISVQHNGANPNSETNRKTEFSSLSFGLSPGIVFFINDHFGIETSIGLFNYTKQNEKYYDNNKQSGSGVNNRFYANFSFSSLFLGMNYYF